MFTVTAYCPCERCNGKWVGQPGKLGRPMQAGRTIAVDPRLIKLGSKVRMNGKEYIAEDTGGAIKGKRIDLFVGSHSEAMKFGKKLITVYKEE